ncbi:MAG: outer membrane protein assembly factor BamA [Desulfovibrionales bacterium]
MKLPNWLLLCAIVIFTLPHMASAQTSEGSKVVVFPFEVNAGEDLQYLTENIPTLLAEELRSAGFEVQDLEETNRLIQEQGVEFLDLQTVKDLTLLSKAQYGLYGSFSQVGETISLDARLVEAFGLKEPQALFVVKEGIINLLPALEQLAQEVKREAQRQDKIAAIEVEGTDTLDKDVVFMRLSTQPGDVYDPRTINEDLRRLFELGYFEDVQVKVEDVPEGKQLTFLVQEKPLIQAIGVKGADAIDKDDIIAAMSIKTGSVVNPKVIADDLETIRQMYRKEGYYNATVDYELEQVDPRRARLNIVINEGNKLYIKRILIQGAEQLDEDDLKDELALSERGLFSFLTGSGVLDEELLNRDAAALEAYYGNRGFMDARVGQPEIEYEEDGIVITFQVEEGIRYRIEEVSFEGDLISQPETLAKITDMDDLAEEKAYFDRSVLRSDTQSLADFYTNFGYAFAEADVNLDKNPEEKTIGVAYVLNKDRKVFIRRVLIEGNTKTRDNVIRRLLLLGDGDQFSGYRLRRSNQRLMKLDYFETVTIDTVPTQSPSELDLKVKVKEKPTGMLSLAAGFSTLENFFFSGQVKERNLFGRGYDIGLRGTFGGRTISYDISFWNPRYKDSKLGLGFDLYLREQDYDDYDKDSLGGVLKFAYPLGEYTRLFWHYRLEQYEISDIDEDANDRIWDFEGANLSSALYSAITRDTTNRRLNPSRGTINTLSAEYAGGLIGGDDDFVKYKYDTSYYRPLFWETVFHWHAQFGYVHENGGGEIPPFERFYLGGINSVRGYEAREISPEDEDGEDIGGDKQFFTNFEFLFPISSDLGLMGLTFFDAGEAWDDDESFDMDLYKSVGVGIRWYSPLGPLRFEYGYPLDELDGEREGKFEFSIGQFF